MARNSLKNVLKLIDAVKEEVPPEQSFLNDLKRSMELDDMKYARKPSQTYKPSSMNCIRGSYYQLIGVEPEVERASYTLIGISNSGSDAHARIQTAVSKMIDNGMECEYVDVADFVRSRGLTDIEVVSKQGNETKLYNKKYNISFLCDGIIKYKNRYYILEIKTETSYKWCNRTYVDANHYKQATAYSLSLGLDNVIFVYVNRDICDMKAYMFHVTDDMRLDIIKYIETCNQYVDQKKTPPKPENVTKKTCEYCSYRILCRSE